MTALEREIGRSVTGAACAFEFAIVKGKSSTRSRSDARKRSDIVSLRQRSGKGSDTSSVKGVFEKNCTWNEGARQVTDLRGRKQSVHEAVGRYRRPSGGHGLCELVGPGLTSGRRLRRSKSAAQSRPGVSRRLEGVWSEGEAETAGCRGGIGKVTSRLRDAWQQTIVAAAIANTVRRRFAVGRLSG